MSFRWSYSRLILLPLIAWLSSCPMAMAITSTTVIEQTVHDYLTERLTSEGTAGRFEITVFPLDERIKLADCNDHLLAKLDQVQPMMGRISVKVSCEIPNQTWTIYAPTYIHIYAPVVVAAQTINRNQILTAADTRIVEQDISAINGGYMTDLQNIAGKAAKRQIMMGYPITEQALGEPTLIKRGASVMIRSSNEHLNVSMDGIALADGVKGESISIKNIHSQRVIRATVTGPNLVETPL